MVVSLGSFVCSVSDFVLTTPGKLHTYVVGITGKAADVRQSCVAAKQIPLTPGRWERRSSATCESCSKRTIRVGNTTSHVDPSQCPPQAILNSRFETFEGELTPPETPSEQQPPPVRPCWTNTRGGKRSEETKAADK